MSNKPASITYQVTSHIPDLVCPHCGSREVGYERKNRHTNGYWNETRHFECGLILTFSPNFMRVEYSDYYPCRHDPEIKELERRRRTARNKLLRYVSKLDLPDGDKEVLNDRIMLSDPFRDR